MGRISRRGELKQAILVVLESVDTAHGYAIMGGVKNRVGGGWKPSPGAICPALLADAAELKQEVLDILARSEGADAFRALDEFGLRLGHGSFLTPTRVEAGLLALQSSGHVTVRRDGPRPIYAPAQRGKP